MGGWVEDEVNGAVRGCADGASVGCEGVKFAGVGGAATLRPRHPRPSTATEPVQQSAETLDAASCVSSYMYEQHCAPPVGHCKPRSAVRSSELATNSCNSRSSAEWRSQSHRSSRKILQHEHQFLRLFRTCTFHGSRRGLAADAVTALTVFPRSSHLSF